MGKAIYKGLPQRIVISINNARKSLRRHDAREPIRASINDGLWVYARGVEHQGRQQLITEDGLSDGDGKGAPKILGDIHAGEGDGEILWWEAFLDSDHGLRSAFSIYEVESW